jgi:hypothetical protein
MSSKQRRGMSVVSTSRGTSSSRWETSSNSTRWYRGSNIFLQEYDSTIGEEKYYPERSKTEPKDLYKKKDPQLVRMGGIFVIYVSI